VVYNSGCQHGLRVPQGKRKHLKSIKTEHRNRLNLEPALVLALTKIRPRTEVLAGQKNNSIASLRVQNHINNLRNIT
jgi:hypothetical protein